MFKTYLAVDGGATKTAIKITDETGYELFSTTFSGTNFQLIGAERLEQIMTHLLTDAANHLHDWQIDAAVFAIAGIDSELDQQQAQLVIARSIQQCPLTITTYVVENDAEATCKGLTQLQPGILVIAGTGAIAYGTNKDILVRAGGWGHRVGDEGSGYWIGQQIARAIFQEADGRGPKTLLTTALFNKLQLTSSQQLLELIYAPSYTNALLASFATILQSCCENGDEVAQTIAQQTAQELVLLTSSIARQLQMNTAALTVYINGGILKNNAYTLKHYRALLQHQFPHFKIHVCKQEPTYYLIQYAMQLYNSIAK